MKKNPLLVIIERLKARLHSDSDELKHKFRETEKAFSRNRLLLFVPTVLMMVRGHKHSIQNGLNKVFEELGALADVPTAGAFSKARKKVKAEVFIELNRGLCQDFYTVYGAEKEVVKWHGQRLLGFDGTVLNLPDTSELRASYSVQSNQHGECVQGLCGVLYDVHNDLGLAAAMGPRTNEARVLMSDSVWQATQKGDVIIMDRNFVHYGLIAFAGKDKRGVIIRCPKCGFTEILDFWESDDIDRLVTLHKPNTSDVRELCEKYDLPSSVQVRLIKVTLSTVDCRLSTGDTEVLLTNLCDAAAYPHPEFQQVYGWRWNEETYFNRFKHIFEVERFSGESKRAIEQTVFGVIFLTTLESIVCQRPQARLREQDLERQNATSAKVNRVVSYVALVNHVVELLADPNASPQQTLEDLQLLFAQSPTRHRPDRRFPRPTRSASQKLRFHRYSKRVIA
jgi:hypothetical protein